MQLLALAIVNAAVLFVAWAVTKAATGRSGLPTLFVAPEFVIIVFSSVLSGLTLIVQGWAIVVSDSVSDSQQVEQILSRSPEGFEAWWLQHREPIMLFFIFLLAAVMVFALDRLVHGTGGGLHSPFMPLLEAPAVLGPFIAREPLGVILSAVAVAAAVAYEVLIHVPLTGLADYGRYERAIVILLVIAVAALVSGAQKATSTSRARKAREAAANRAAPAAI
jgi:hypothetical protein